jgi:hypothetical protein
MNDVDKLYPALSALAEGQIKGCTLNALGKCAHQKDCRYLRLADCCDMVRNGWPRWSVDPYHYLATLDQFVSTFNNDLAARRNVWRKLSGSPSQFLDTVVEAAWALQFRDSGLSVAIETPFDSKNADFLLTHNGNSYWLDVLSVDVNKRDSCTEKPADSVAKQRGSEKSTTSIIVGKATEKYRSKFREAVKCGSLKGSSVGVLLCVMKSERAVLSPLLPNALGSAESSLVHAMFDKQDPAFTLVLVHTLRPREHSDLLQPVPVAKWTRSGGDAFGWLFSTLL